MMSSSLGTPRVNPQLAASPLGTAPPLLDQQRPLAADQLAASQQGMVASQLRRRPPAASQLAASPLGTAPLLLDQQRPLAADQLAASQRGMVAFLL